VGGNGRFFSNPTFAIPTTRAIVDLMLVDVPNGFFIDGMSLAREVPK
jgi:hypothetical protein